MPSFRRPRKKLPPPTTTAICWVAGRRGQHTRRVRAQVCGDGGAQPPSCHASTPPQPTRLDALQGHGGHLSGEVEDQVGVNAEAGVPGEGLARDFEEDSAPATPRRRGRQAEARDTGRGVSETWVVGESRGRSRGQSPAVWRRRRPNDRKAALADSSLVLLLRAHLPTASSSSSSSSSRRLLTWPPTAEGVPTEWEHTGAWASSAEGRLGAHPCDARLSRGSAAAARCTVGAVSGRVWPARRPRAAAVCAMARGRATDMNTFLCDDWSHARGIACTGDVRGC